MPLIPSLAALLVAGSALAPAAAQTSHLARLADEAAIIRISNDIDRAVDRKDWATARGFFADQVKVDFTSLIGGQPATIKADDLIAGWRGNLGPKKTSLHLRGNHVVDVAGDTAIIRSHAYAWNRMEGNGDPLWEVWGDYTYDLAREAGGWKVTSFTFNMTHERGNMWVKTTPAPAN